MKYIIVLLLLAVSVQAGVEYTPTTTGADSLGAISETAGAAFYRSGYKMAMDQSGNLFLIYKHRSSNQRATNILKTSDWGVSWSSDSLILGEAVFPNQIYCFGDSCYIIGVGNNVPPVIRKYVGLTKSILDTVTFGGDEYTGTNRVAMGLIAGTLGDQILVVNRTGSSLMQYCLSTGEMTQSTVWNPIGTSVSIGEGIRMPFRFTGAPGGAIITYDWGIYKYLYSIDSVSGLDTLNTSWIPYGTANTSECGINLKGDTGLFAYQYSKTGTTNALWVKKFRVHDLGEHLGGVTVIDSALIESAGFIAGEWISQPTLSSVFPTDTAFIFYVMQADTLNEKDSLDICYKMSTDGGTTWGSRQILKAAVKGKKIWSLQSPPDLYSADNTIRIAVAYTDSTVGTTADQNDKLNVYLETLNFGMSQTVSIISKSTTTASLQDVYSGGSNIDTVWGFYHNENTLIGADSVYDASSLGSPDTVNITGLTPGSQYWFWCVISDDNGRDTSASTNIWTSPVPLVSIVVDTLKNDYSGELDSIRIRVTTGNSGIGSYVIVVLSSTGYQDSSYITYRDSIVYPGENVEDTIYIVDFAGNESYDAYVSGWNFHNNAGYSARTTGVRAYGGLSDFTAPDNHSLFEILYIENIDPDSVKIAVGTVDSVDYDTTQIRWDTSSVPTISSGYVLYAGGVKENDTSFYTLGIVQPHWVYFKIFAGDEVPNWSTGGIDSVYFPKTPVGGGGSVNKAFYILMNKQED